MLEEWIRAQLGDVGTFQKGKGITKSDLSDNGIPCLRYAEIYTTFGDVTSQLKSFVSIESASEATSIKYGDIVFAASGETSEDIGKAVAFIGRFDAVAGGDTVILRDHGQDPSYLAHALNSHSVVRQKSRLGKGQSVVHIHASDLASVTVDLPPLPEQRKIAGILRTWDEAIEKLAALKTAKLRRHRALTHSLVFGTRQLDRFRTTDEVTEHRWFTLPATWGMKPIGKLAREISERNGDGEQHEVLSCSKYDGFVRSLEYFKKQVFSADLSGYKKIWRGDFGFPSNHVEEGSIGLQNLTDVGLVSPIYTVFRFASEKVDADYAFAVLKTGLYRHIFEVSTSASVDRRGSLRWSEFSKLPFPLPSLVEQRAIAEVLRTAQTDLDALNTEIEALTRQKRGLMQKLLTGEWRVTV